MNPQCIQFVITSAVDRVIPVGTELTVGFDFDYTACSYPVRCACGRGPSLCAVADWFRRHRQLSIAAAAASSLHQRNNYRGGGANEETGGDAEHDKSKRCAAAGGEEDGPGDYEFDNEYDLSGEENVAIYERNRGRFLGDKTTLQPQHGRSRLPLK